MWQAISAYFRDLGEWWDRLLLPGDDYRLGYEVGYHEGREAKDRMKIQQAWDEGFRAGHRCSKTIFTSDCARENPNPYRRQGRAR